MATILGTSAAETLNGGVDDDIVLARGGNDSVDGGGGNDLILGQGGTDSLAGGVGADTLIGGAGDDELNGGSGSEIDFATYEEASFSVPGTIAVELVGGVWQVETAASANTAAEGTDTLIDIEIVEGGAGGRVLLVGAGGFESLQAAVNAANSGDTILIADGAYTGDVTIADKALTIRGQGKGALETVITGQITVTGTLDGTLTFEDLRIDASGKQYGILLQTVSPGAGSLVLDGVDVRNASVNGLLYFHPSNAAQTNVATSGLLDAVTINDSDFTNNGGGTGPNGRGAINLFGFNGALTVTDNSFSSSGGNIQKAISIAGTGRPDTAPGRALLGTDLAAMEVLSPLGPVLMTGNDITGTYTQDAISFYYFEGFAGFEASGNTANATAPWGLLNLDSVGGTVDVSGFFDSAVNTAPGALVSNPQGLAGSDSLIGTDGVDQLIGRGGDDSMDGGAGDDSFVIDAAGHHGAGEVIDGGDDDDVVIFASTTAGETLVLQSTVTDVEAAIVANRAGVATGTTTLHIDASAVTGLEMLAGNEGANALTGGADAQTILGNGGDDSLKGGGGNDLLLGGIGTDEAHFSGDLTDYSFSMDSSGRLTVTGPDGSDLLGSVERLVFADRTVLVVDGTGVASETSSIAAAMLAAAGVEGPVTVLVAPGTYNENVVISRDDLTLISVAGREATTIAGNDAGGELGAVQLTPGRSDVQVGATGQGFTIIGLDGPPGIEKGAIYLQGNQTDIVIQGNDVVADGDAGLTSEFSATLVGLLVDGNIFSGQTFAGANPGGIGFGAQFSASNVPRQLVVLGNGGGAAQSPSSGIVFTNNQITGAAGGISTDDGLTPQGNSLVTIDATGTLVQGNSFTGYTAGNGYALRVRRGDTDIIDNTLDHTSGGGSRGIFVQNSTPGSAFSGNEVLGNNGAAEIIFSMTPGADSLDGAGGADLILSGDGQDTVLGGAGDDSIVAGGGADSVDTGLDNDSIYGTTTELAADSIAGGDGDDAVRITDMTAGDIVFGANVSGIERIEVRLNDTVLGSVAVDVDAAALAELEQLTGNDGANALTTGEGIQTLTGNGGDDILSGGADNDVLDGGAGTDTAAYGAGLGVAAFSIVGGAWKVDAGDEGIDSLSGIEVVTSGGVTYRLVGAGGYVSIQAAIDAAGEDDIILIAPQTYTEVSAGVNGGTSQGLYIDTAGLQLIGFSGATGVAVASAQEAKDSGPVVIAGSTNQFGASHWIDEGGTGTVIQGLHLKAGPTTNNKLLEIWADETVVSDSFLNVYATVGEDEVYTQAVAIYFNETDYSATDAINAFDIRDNILNEGIVIATGVGDPSILPTNLSPLRITGNTFEGSFDGGSGEGRYDTIVINGQVTGIGWLLEPTGTPWIAGNSFGDNTTPFLLRGSDDLASNLPSAETIATILASNGGPGITYVYVVDSDGDLVTAPRPGPYRSFAVFNSIDTLNLGLDATADNVFGGLRQYVNPGDTLIVQSASAATSAVIMVENVTVQATANSVDFNLTLGTTLVDGTPIAGGGVVALTLGDYAPGLGADVDVTGNALGNTITGNSGQNRLDGGAGNDSLEGGDGSDELIGGIGNDTIAADGDDAIDGGDDVDEVRSSITFSLATDAMNVENLALTGEADIDGTGNAGANVITGNTGANILDGGAGADAMAGGGGNDTYLVDDANDSVTELADGGTDLVIAAVSHTLAANVENLTLTGEADIDGTGNAGANVITGNAGANIIDGGAGADAMSGGDGNDTYVVDDAGDAVTELADEGTDLVLASVSHTLAANVENLTLTGGSAINGTGNALDNVITGNGAANMLTGGAGDDNIDGGGGIDTAAYATVLTADDIQSIPGGFTVAAGAEGTDTISGAEIVAFTGGRFLLVGTGGFATLAAALAVAVEGDTVILGGGTHAGGITVGFDLTILGRGGATIDGGITLTGGDLALQDLAIVNAGIQVFALAGAGSLSLDGVTMTGPGSMSGTRGIEVVANGAAVSVTDGAISSYSSGIYLNPGSSLTVSGTSFTGNFAAIGTEGPALLNVQGASFDGNEEAIGLTGGTLNPDVTLIDNDYVTGTDQVKLYGPVTEILPGDFTGAIVSAPASLQTALNAVGTGETVYVGAGNYGTGPFSVPVAGVLVQGGSDAVAGQLQLATPGLLTLLGAAAFSVLGTTGSDTILGNAGANALSGGSGADSLSGGGGNDLLEGASGADAMVGGLGDDTYSVDNIGDSVTEAADEGIDLVRSSISHALGANLENLTLTGAASSAGTGNGLGNVITGNNGHNTLDGGAGNDSLAGGGGTDLLIGGSGDDTLSGGAGVDTIDYSAAAGPVTVDLSLGTAVGDGADVLIGVEAVIGSAAADEITGNGAANLLSGLAGDDYLEGGSGSDTLMGGEGADILVGGSGVDQASYANAQGAVAASLATSSGTAGDAADDFIVGIENLLGGDFADTLEGNAAANLLEGGAGDDLLSGGAGADTLDGGAGVDAVTYAAAATTVTVQLTSSGGTATDQFGSTDTLISIDNVVGGSGDDVLLGNGNANQLEGGAGADNINGGAGDDLILGGAGVDVLVGTFGNDTLVGGADADVLNGGAGDDVFMFLEPGDLGTTRGTADRIVAVDGAGIAGGDLIDLSALDAIAGTPSDEAFVFQGSFTSNVAFTGAGYIRAVKTASATFIELNTTGGSAADLVIRVNGVYDFAASDFIL